MSSWLNIEDLCRGVATSLAHVCHDKLLDTSMKINSDFITAPLMVNWGTKDSKWGQAKASMAKIVAYPAEI
jgi:hypothetical protein